MVEDDEPPDAAPYPARERGDPPDRQGVDLTACRFAPHIRISISDGDEPGTPGPELSPPFPSRQGREFRAGLEAIANEGVIDVEFLPWGGGEEGGNG